MSSAIRSNLQRVDMGKSALIDDISNRVQRPAESAPIGLAWELPDEQPTTAAVTTADPGDDAAQIVIYRDESDFVGFIGKSLGTDLSLLELPPRRRPSVGEIDNTVDVLPVMQQSGHDDQHVLDLYSLECNGSYSSRQCSAAAATPALVDAAAQAEGTDSTKLADVSGDDATPVDHGALFLPMVRLSFDAEASGMDGDDAAVGATGHAHDAQPQQPSVGASDVAHVGQPDQPTNGGPSPPSVVDFIASLTLPLEVPLIQSPPRLRVSRVRDEDLVLRRSERLAAKSVFRDPNPEKQAKRVLLRKW
jgi:hypothetical protein